MKHQKQETLYLILMSIHKWQRLVKNLKIGFKENIQGKFDKSRSNEEMVLKFQTL